MPRPVGSFRPIPRVRRAAAAPLVALVLLVPHAAPAQGAAEPAALPPPRWGDPLVEYETVRVADGVWAFVAPDSRTSLVNANTLLVVGDSAALVVDGGHFPTLARRVIADARRLTTTPVRWLVNTHWHEDHVIGTGEWRAAWPGLAIVATRAARDSIVGKVPGMVAEEVRTYPAALDGMRAVVRTGRHADGREATPAARERLAREVADYERALPELAAMRHAPPTVAFADTFTIDLGGRVVRLLHLGRGATDGDAVVHVPDARVVATGDLVVAPAPFAFGAYVGEWPATLRRLAALDATAIVPGHGPVLRDWTYARVVADLLDAIGAQVRAAAAEGLDLAQARARLDVAALRRRLTGGDPTRERLLDEFTIGPAAARAHAAARADGRVP